MVFGRWLMGCLTKLPTDDDALFEEAHTQIEQAPEEFGNCPPFPPFHCSISVGVLIACCHR
jgi:hypothetical protein